VRVEIVNPVATERKRLYEEGGALAADFRELEEHILSVTNGKLPPQLNGRVVAATNEKTPLQLTPGEPTVVPLEIAQPAAGPAGASKLDMEVTGGLICIITNVEKQSERFVKWLDLRPYNPDELFRVEDFTVDGNNLSFKVGLLSDELAVGMGLDERPVGITWDRKGVGLLEPNPVEGDLKPGGLVTTLKGAVLVDATKRSDAELRPNAIVRLHVDNYPRAFLYQLQLNDSKVIEQNNLKRNRTVGVHLSRLAFEKRAYHILPRNSAFQPAVEPEVEPPIPDFIVEKIQRGNSRHFAGFKLDNRQPRQTLTFDLEADVSTAAFANGAAIEVVAQEGQKPLRFYRDRDVRIQLVPKLGSTGLYFRTSVSDFHETIQVDADTEQDTRLTLAATVRSNNDSPNVDSVHEVPVVFDRLSPVVLDARLVSPQIDTYEGRPALPAVVKFTVTDNQGVGTRKVQAMLAQRGVKVEPNPDNIIEYPNPSNGELQLELPIPGDLKAGAYEFRVLLEPVDKVDRLGKKIALDLNVNVRPVPVLGTNKPRTTFGQDTNKQADAIKENEKKKLILPAMPPPGGAAGS